MQAARTIQDTPPSGRWPGAGAWTVKNTSRSAVAGRARRRYAAIAAPTSAGIGSCVHAVGLAVHGDLSGPPVQILQSQPGHLAGA